MGALSLGANTLNVASSDTTATPYSLTFNGASTLTGNGTINVANSTGGGAGTVRVSTLGDGGHGYSLTKTGPGVLSMNGLGTYSGGTVVSGGLVIANGPGTIGTGAGHAQQLEHIAVGRRWQRHLGFATLIPNLDNTAGTWTVNGTSATFGNQGFTNSGNSSSLMLTDGNGNEASSAWFNTPQSIKNSLRVKFTYQMMTGTSAGDPADGTTFALQNTGINALGGGGGSMGYTGINNSAAYEINIYGGHVRGAAVGANGAINYASVAPVRFEGDLTTGDVVNVTLTYDAIAGTITQNLQRHDEQHNVHQRLSTRRHACEHHRQRHRLCRIHGCDGRIECNPDRQQLRVRYIYQQYVYEQRVLSMVAARPRSTLLRTSIVSSSRHGLADHQQRGGHDAELYSDYGPAEHELRIGFQLGHV